MRGCATTSFAEGYSICENNLDCFEGRRRQGGRGFVHPRTNIAGRGPRETSYREAMTQAIVGGSEVQQAAISGEANEVPRPPAAAARSSNAQLISEMTTQAFRR